MAWPDSKICNGCKKIFKADKCTIDIGEFGNLREDMVYACSEECASEAKNNWLKKDSNG